MKKMLFALCAFFIVSACSSSKPRLSNDKTFEVSFGSYGGFSNQTSEYLLDENGRVFKVENDHTRPLNPAGKKEFKKIKNQLENIDFENITTDEPGNLTYFIKVKTSDYTNTVRWNDNSQNTELSNTFKMLVGILQ